MSLIEEEEITIKKKYINKFAIAVTVVMLVCTCINFLLPNRFKDLFLLDSDQLLYLFSSMAQILGGLFGLTLTAFVFFVDKFKDESVEDESLYDAVMALLHQYYQSLGVIACSSGISIGCALFGIISLHNIKTLYPFIINESVILFTIDMISILYFGIALMDPKKLEKEMLRLKTQAEKSLDPDLNGSTEKGDFIEFLKYYNLLDELIKKFAEDIFQGCAYHDSGNRKTSNHIIQALKALGSRQIIGADLAGEINALRMYRNSLVHGVDFEVSKFACDRVIEIYKALNNAYKVHEKLGTNNRDWEDAVQQIHELTRTKIE